jgi:photosystem II stability/assembly factor-like uncharacterized protein
MRTTIAAVLLVAGIAAAPPASAAPPAGAPIDKLLILDAQRIGERIVCVGERGYILYSDDDGHSWQAARSPTDATLTALHFPDPGHGYAVGHDAVILRSTDRGASWTQVHAAPEKEAPLLDVWFADTRHGYAVGAYGAFYETRDGGDSWQARAVLDTDRHFNAVTGAPDGQLYLAGESGTLAHSPDRGASWRPLPSPYRGSLFGILRVADGGLLTYGLRGRVYRSADGGRGWQQIDAPNTASLMGGTVLADGTVVLLGHDGAVLVSRDHGRRFAPQASHTRRALIAAVPAGGDRGLLLFGEAEPGAARAFLEHERF